MGAGVEIYNESGVMQIDGSWSAMALVDKRTLAVTAGFSFTLTGRAAPIVLWDSDNYINPTFVTVSGSTWTFHFYPAPGGTTNVTFYTFDFTSTVVTPANYGLQIFDATGRLLFDAVAGRYFKPITLSSMTVPGAGPSFSVPAGKTWAIGWAVPIYAMQAQTSDTTHIYYGSAKRSGQTISTAYYTDILTGTIPPDNAITGQWIVADVTNY